MSTTALTAVLAKLAGLQVAAKVGVGLAVAAGAVGAAAGLPVVAQHLGAPDAVQVAVTDQSDLATDASDPADPVTDPSDATDPTDPATDPTDPATDPSADLLDLTVPFGWAVSTQAREGGVNGQEISEAARTRAELRAQDRATSAGVPAPGTRDAGDQDRTRDQDRTQDEDCVQDQTRDQTQDQTQDQTRDQTQDGDGSGTPGGHGEAHGRG